MKGFRSTLLIGWLSLLTGCSFYSTDGPPAHPRDVSALPDAVPRFEARSRSANPDSYEVLGRRYRVLKSTAGYVERGIASWYGRKFHGRKTASGEPYDMYQMTAAHRTLPIPSYVRVTNLRSGKSVIVRINDRGPFHPNRIIDLSYAAAVKLGLDRSGTAPVEIRALEPPAASNRGIYLQLGAFSSRANAERLLARLNDRHFSKVRIDNRHQRGRTLYRVRLGPLTSQTQVDDLTQQLKALGITPAIVND